MTGVTTNEANVKYVGHDNLTRLGNLATVLGDGSISANGDGDGTAEWTYTFPSPVLVSVFIPAGMIQDTDTGQLSCPQTLLFID